MDYQHDVGTLYRRFSITFFCVAPLAAACLIAGGWFLTGAGVLTAANLMFWIPTVIPNHQWHGRTVTSFHTSEPEVWLTIDDGPSPDDTADILRILDRSGAKATFFLIGDRAQQHSQSVRDIRDAGHQIGNHTYRHPAHVFWALPPRIFRSELSRWDECLARVAGTRSALFRPPVGMKNPLLQGVLDDAGLTHIGWSARGHDGVSKCPEKILARIRPRLRPGAVILIHQGNRTPDGRLLAPIVLEGLFRDLDERGLRCVIPAPDSYRPAGGRPSDSC